MTSIPCGATFFAARSSDVLVDFRRRLPEMATMRITAEVSFIRQSSGVALQRRLFATHRFLRLHSLPFALHSSRFALHPSPFPLHSSPFTLRPAPFPLLPSTTRTT